MLNDYNASVKEDLENRQHTIDKGEALDKDIRSRMNAGEIGISHGTDNHVGVIMLGLATVFTLFCLFVIFDMSPAHYSG